METTALTPAPEATPATGPRGPRSTAPMEYVPFEIVRCARQESHAAAEGEDGDAAEESANTYRVVLSNERQIVRSWALLTWSHEKSAIDMSYAKNGLSLLLEHGHRTGDQKLWNMIDPELHVGVIENIELNGSQLEGDLRFSDSALAQQAERDVENRTRRYVSLAMVPLKMKPVKKATSPDELDEYLVTRWMPVEGSLVSVPANPQARVKNSAGAQEYPVEIESDTPEPEVHSMSTIAPVTPDPAAPAPDRAAVEAAVSARNKTIADIVKLCNDQGHSALAAGFIERNLTLPEAGLELLKHKSERGEVKGISAEIREQLSLKDRKRYRMSKALNEQCEIREGGGRLTGLEAEVHAFVRQRAIEAGVVEHGGVWLPTDILDGVEKHSMTTTQVGKGAELVFDQPAGMIEMLRAESVCASLGAQTMGDLVGQIPFVRQNGDITVYFPGENPPAAVSESDPALGMVTLAAKTMMGAGRISRQLIRLASYSAEERLMESFAAAHALAFDRQALHGTAGGGQCTGIYQASDVGAVAFGGAPTWQKFLDMIVAVGTANAHKGSLAFLTTVGMAGKLKNTLIASTAGSNMVWQGRIDDGSIDGYKAVASNQASSVLGASADEHALIFGNWRELIFGLWGGLEVLVDPYTEAGKAMVKLTSFQMGDVIQRHGQSFVKATGAKLA